MGKKTKYSFIHEPIKKDSIPLCLSKLIFNNYEMRRIERNENKIGKNIGISYKARLSLDKRVSTTRIFTHT